MATDEKKRPSQAPNERKSLPPDGRERRSYERIPVDWKVDYQSGETFLYSYITNISAMGIFIYSKEPLPIGARINLNFLPPGEDPFALVGEVAWVNPWHEHGENLNPGMGVRFTELDLEARERLVQLVKTIAYLNGGTEPPSQQDVE